MSRVIKRRNNKFTYEEDATLRKLVKQYGEHNWIDIATHMKGRNVRQVHDRWVYYLSPKVNSLPWTDEEDDKLIKLTKELNGKWVQIAKRFDGRTDNQIKNRWNILKKRFNLENPPKKRGNKDITPETSAKESPAPQIIDHSPATLTFSDTNIDAVLDQLISVFQVMDSNESDLFNDYSFW